MATKPSDQPSASPILSVEHLTAGYGRLEILHELSLQVMPGSFVGLLGPNGSGKSTLLKSLFGLTTLFSGRIAFDGRELNGVSTESISRHGIAYVPQRNNVFTSLGVGENLMLALRRLPRTEALSARDEALELFPILKERTEQKAGRLSGGERQMLAIALGWLAQPRLMLLDEPSAGLSPRFVTDVFRTLQTLSDRGLTLLVVEQNARSLLRWCEYAFILREGRLVFEGPATDLHADEEQVKRYLGVAL